MCRPQNSSRHIPCAVHLESWQKLDCELRAERARTFCRLWLFEIFIVERLAVGGLECDIITVFVGLLNDQINRSQDDDTCFQ
jgi:hypothetical protein